MEPRRPVCQSRRQTSGEGQVKAVAFQGIGRPLAVTRQPAPTAGPGELVLEVAFCGICGSDLHATEHASYGLPAGTVLGHEFAGIVVDSGDPAWQAGDRVAAVPLWVCDACVPNGDCRDGLGPMCPHSRFVGLTAKAPGAYAERVRIRAAQALRLPDSVSLRDGALLEPLAVGAHAVAAAGPIAGAAVLVIGGGPIGLAVAIMARLAGAASVTVSEPSPVRRDYARRIGATHVLDPRPGTADGGDVGAAFRAAAGTAPAMIFECVGAPGILQHCLELLAPRGRIVVVGVCMAEDRLMPRLGIRKEASIRFVLGYERADFARVLRHIEAGEIDAGALVSSVIGLDAVPAAFEALRTPNEQVKVLIAPGGA